MTLPHQENANPYAAPTTDLGSVVANYGSGDITQEQAEEIRRVHIGHEASVRSIGLLYFLGGFFGIVGLIFSVVGIVSLVSSGGNLPTTAMVGLAISLGMTAMQLALGVGLRQLRPWARIGASILTVLVLLYFAVLLVASSVFGGAGVVEVMVMSLMSAVPAYILWLLAGAKGRMVFSPKYQAIREMTPEIKYQTSIIIKVFAVLLLGLILIAVVFAFTGGITV